MAKDNNETTDLMREALGWARLPTAKRRAKIISLPGGASEDPLSQKRILELLRRLDLDGMADALEEQSDSAKKRRGSFEDRLARLLKAELSDRGKREIAARLLSAGLPYRARVEDIDYNRPRGLVKPLMRSLSSCQWVGQGANLVISGPTGAGKTFLVCALGHNACRNGFNVAYRDQEELTRELSQASNGLEATVLPSRLSDTELLIIDEWGSASFSTEEGQRILALLRVRGKDRSCAVCGRMPVRSWPDLFANPAHGREAQELLAGDAYRIKLSGQSMRAGSGSTPLIALDTE